MFALLLAPAWAGTWTIQLPPDQRAADWEDALELTGMVAVSNGECHARVRCESGGCMLAIRDGDAWRTTAIPAPSSPEAREEIALKARSMLQARVEVQNEWKPDLSDFLEEEPPPPPPPLPTFTVPAPELSPYPLPETTFTVNIPYEVATWSGALQPERLVDERAPLTLWGALSAGGERRAPSSFGVGGGAAGGVAMFDRRVGLGLDLSAHSPTRYDSTRAWSTWGGAGTVWFKPTEQLRVSALVGGHLLRFTESGSTTDAVQRTFVGLDTATPTGPLWLTARVTAELAPVTLYEVNQLGQETVLAELGRLWAVQLGARWWFGK